MKRYVLALAVSITWGTSAVLAADHTLQPLDEAAPSDAIAPEILEQLAPTGIKVLRGKRTVCDLWLCQSWTAKADFESTATIIYPFEVGQLIGVARYKGKGTDFRGQGISPGVYVLRYGHQPIDGNHVGTSDTLDFLLLTPADADRTVEPMAAKELFKLSAQVAGSKHPTILSLVRPAGSAESAPSIRHDEEHDLWIVTATAKKAGGEELQPLEVVVVGQSPH
jgi:hypothetical protein